LRYNCSGTNNEIKINNCSFTNCNASNQGGAIYITNIPLTISGTSFSNNVANGSKGNDIYVSSTFTYSSSSVVNSCSDSEIPKILMSSTDLSDLLDTCATYVEVYLASSTHSIPGNDDNNNDCSVINPCLTIFHALQV
jgi:hypothetical protein